MRTEFDLWLRRILRGGTTGQFLRKVSNKTHDFEWATPVAGSGGSKSYSFFVGS